MPKTSADITLSVTLANGSTHNFNVVKVPPNWKSWLMHQLPYGTNFQGATFQRHTPATSGYEDGYQASLNDHGIAL